MSIPSTFRTALRLAAALLVTAFTGLGHAQPSSGRSEAVVAPSWRPLVLVVADAAQPVRLQALRVETEIAGGVAETRVQMTFFNPNGRTLEGRLRFPLGASQTVTGFALDVQGAMREAVPVPRARAEQVFEDITRQRVDPGLLQHTQGNEYELRIYPLEPGRTRTVVVRLTEPAATRLFVPLAYAPTVPKLEVTLRFPAATARPRIDGGEAIGLRITADPCGGYVASAVRTDTVLPRVPLAVGAVDAADTAISTEARAGDAWFSGSVAVNDRRGGPRSLPRQVQIVWDQSASGAQRDTAREFALLDAYFRHAGTIDVSLVRVADTVSPPERFRIRGGDWSALRDSLRATVYDGASRLGAVGHDGVSAESIWFSDGLSTWGPAWTPAFAVPVYAVSSAATGHPEALAQLAERTGGRFVDLRSLSNDDARRALLERRTQVVAVTATGARDVVLDTRTPTAGRIAIAGAFNAGKAEVTLHLIGADGKRSTRTLRIVRGQNPAHLAGTQWARLTLATLVDDTRADRARADELGQRFRIAGPRTSLVVLERVEDYVRHGIEPPAELAAAYAKLSAATKVGRERSEAERIAGVVQRFEAKTAWWARSFPKDEPGRGPQQQIAALRGGLGAVAADGTNGRELRPSPTAPAPAVSSMCEQAADAAKSSSRVTRKRSGSGSGADDLEPRDIAIALKPASTDTAWLKRLERSVDDASRLAVYLDERRSNERSVGFFLEAADWFLARGDAASRAVGLRTLSNLAEMDLHNRQVLRLLGYRLGQAGQHALAVSTFERVLDLAAWEPQSHRDLGLALAAAGEPQRAVDALYDVVAGAWDSRFPDIDLITLGELNAIVATAARGGVTLDTKRIDPRLLRNLTLDLRVVLAWDADATDVDLHVFDPNGEEVFYGHALSYQGGRISRDATGGYGPEEFALRVAKPGRYRIEANFYGHRQQVLTTSTGLMLWLSSGFGTSGQVDRRTTLRLRSSAGQRVAVGEFDVGGGRL